MTLNRYPSASSEPETRNEAVQRAAAAAVDRQGNRETARCQMFSAQWTASGSKPLSANNLLIADKLILFIFRVFFVYIRS